MDLVTPFPSPTSPKKSLIILIVSAIVIVAIGSLTGFLLSRGNASKSTTTSTTTPKEIKTDKEVGSLDTKTFRDSAQGKLEKGGFQGEGTHKLILDNNPKNAAYLVSSVVELDQFVGKHVEVWGETMKAQKVPWLMDVGRVKILD